MVPPPVMSPGTEEFCKQMMTVEAKFVIAGVGGDSRGRREGWDDPCGGGLALRHQQGLEFSFT